MRILAILSLACGGPVPQDPKGSDTTADTDSLDDTDHADDTDPGSSASATVGDGGGVLTFGGVTVTIPPGALEAPVDLVLTVDSEAPAGVVALGPVVHLGPSGVALAAPIEIILPWTPPGFAGLYWGDEVMVELDATIASGTAKALVSVLGTGFVAQTRMGAACTEEQQVDHDPQVDVRVQRTFDALGHALTVARDDAGACTYEGRTETPGECPFRCDLTCSPEADGVADFVQVSTWSPDGTMNASAADHDGACVILTCDTGAPIDPERCPGGAPQQEVCGPDGVDDGRTLWTYDANGRPVRSEVDEDLDGAADVVTAYSWEGTRQLGYQIDDRSACAFTTTPHRRCPGDVCQFDCSEVPDGVPDTVVTWVWEGARIVGQQTDHTGACTEISCTGVSDGEAEVCVTEVESASTCGPDGAPDVVTAWELDAAGRRVEETVDQGADGVIDRRTTWTWAPEGWILAEEVDHDSPCRWEVVAGPGCEGSAQRCDLVCTPGVDGIVDVRRSFQRDAAGRVLREDVDDAGACATETCTEVGDGEVGCDSETLTLSTCGPDGVAEQSTTKAYSCWP